MLDKKDSQPKTHRPHLNRILYYLAILTVFVVFSRDILPERRWEWVPNQDGAAFTYSDIISGGSSTSGWLDEKSLDFHCEIIKSNQTDPPYCGFHIHFHANNLKGVDLSRYHHMNIDIDYVGGNEKLRLYMNDFVPGITNPKIPVISRTAKYMGVFIDAEEAKAPFSIRLDEFNVAEWWLNEFNVPREHSIHSRNQVIIFGIDIVYPTALGLHTVKVNKITFIGDWVSAEQWYLGIVFSWVALLLITGITRHLLLIRYTKKLKKDADTYQKISEQDQLTGLLNRHGLKRIYENLSNNQLLEVSSSILLIDIDLFKKVNDRYGHNAGDLVLVRISHALRSSVEKKGKTARWGGEEFLILLPNTNHEEACRLAESIRGKIAAIKHPALNNEMITLSIGVCSIPKQGSLFETIESADEALYEAKSRGRNRVVSYHAIK
ncbi:MAG: GGDEF domain-containing protein [Colwellia sp.]